MTKVPRKGKLETVPPQPYWSRVSFEGAEVGSLLDVAFGQFDYTRVFRMRVRVLKGPKNVKVRDLKQGACAFNIDTTLEGLEHLIFTSHGGGALSFVLAPHESLGELVVECAEIVP